MKYLYRSLIKPISFAEDPENQFFSAMMTPWLDLFSHFIERVQHNSWIEIHLKESWVNPTSRKTVTEKTFTKTIICNANENDNLNSCLLAEYKLGRKRKKKTISKSNQWIRNSKNPKLKVILKINIKHKWSTRAKYYWTAMRRHVKFIAKHNFSTISKFLVDKLMKTN